MLDSARRSVAKWVHTAVIGHNLCPFAHKPWNTHRVLITAVPARDLQGAATAFATAAHELLTDEGNDTVLVVYPDALDSFDEFLEALDLADAYLEDQDLQDSLQIAHFHPEYRFDGVPTDAPSNATNRAPFPTIQILRVTQMADAIESHDDTAAIPVANIKVMEAFDAQYREDLRTLHGAHVALDTPLKDQAAFEAFVAERLSAHPTEIAANAAGPKALYLASAGKVTFAQKGAFSSRSVPEHSVVFAGPWFLRSKAGDVWSAS